MTCCSFPNGRVAAGFGLFKWRLSQRSGMDKVGTEIRAVSRFYSNPDRPVSPSFYHQALIAKGRTVEDGGRVPRISIGCGEGDINSGC